MKLQKDAVLAASMLVVVGLATQHGMADDDQARVTPELMARWGSSQYVFSGNLEKVVAGPVGRSLPPVYTHKLEMTIAEVFRGPLKKGDVVALSHVARQMTPPTFPKSELCLVSASKTRGSLRVDKIVKATRQDLAQVRLASQVPLGWTANDKGLLSPWASMPNSWPTAAASRALICSKTGRPALLVGAGIEFTVAPVPPAKSIKWTNPDGDGEYKITVTNTTKQRLDVPALLSIGDKILWKESLVILCQAKAYALPGSVGVSSEPRATSLDPGQSMSTVVNALGLPGPKWPRGGYRIEFQFCLGELSSVQSFYYMSRHHDEIRKKLQDR